MNSIKVCKFGGGSNASPNGVSQIKRIMNDDLSRRVVVISAPGRPSPSNPKVTDMLIAYAKTKEEGTLESIVGRYESSYPGSRIRVETRLRQRIRNSEGLSGKAYFDSIVSMGEELSGLELARTLDFVYVDPQAVLRVSCNSGRTEILSVSEEMTRNRFNQRGRFVLPGFFGYNEEGIIATFSRGGSDLTGSFVAAALDAEVYENFTDVDGVFAANRNIVTDARKINKLTFKEMRDLSYGGFGVFHPEAIGPVSEKMVRVHIRGTSSYPSEGTYVVHDRLSDPTKPIVGVAYGDGFCSFDVEGFGLNENVGVMRRIFQVFEDREISIEFSPSAIDDISVILKESQLGDGDCIDEIIRDIHRTIGNKVTVDFQEHLASLVVAGKGLKGSRGVSADIQSTLAGRGINIQFIQQGARERSIIYGVHRSDGPDAVNAIYDKYLR
ncbi:hypothetical protein J4430_02220 [Candidatus Woesearchaeota archaeon]|nr:hypothetical protein [Candidatus Woesearchaeota archaeon]